VEVRASGRGGRVRDGRRRCCSAPRHCGRRVHVNGWGAGRGARGRISEQERTGPRFGGRRYARSADQEDGGVWRTGSRGFGGRRRGGVPVPRGADRVAPCPWSSGAPRGVGRRAPDGLWRALSSSWRTGQGVHQLDAVVRAAVELQREHVLRDDGAEPAARDAARLRPGAPSAASSPPGGGPWRG
jgi:hypothetical protein